VFSHLDLLGLTLLIFGIDNDDILSESDCQNLSNFGEPFYLEHLSTYYIKSLDSPIERGKLIR